MATELDVLVVVVFDGRNGVQILAYEVAQYAVTRAMQDTHAAHSNQCGVINKVHYSLYSLVTAHATNINIRFESQFTVVDVIVGLLANVCGGAYILNLYRLGRLQTVSLDRSLNEPERNCYIVFVYSYDFTNLCLTSQTYRIANLIQTFRYLRTTRRRLYGEFQEDAREFR